jgi:predicted Zn-ribbon and HTH transcriptional regulator
MITIPKDRKLEQGYHPGVIESASLGQLDNSGTNFLQLVITIDKVQVQKRYFFTMEYQCSNCRATFDKPTSTCPHCRNTVIHEPFYWLVRQLFQRLDIKPVESGNGSETYDESALAGRKVLALVYYNSAGYMEVYNLLKPRASKTEKARLLVKLEQYMARSIPVTIESNPTEGEPVESVPF